MTSELSGAVKIFYFLYFLFGTWISFVFFLWILVLRFLVLTLTYSRVFETSQYFAFAHI